MEGMRILIAPDKFKGSLTAAEAAAAIAEGALRVYPDAVATQFPIADGGEGTLEAALSSGYEERINAVTGPILAPVGAAWAIAPDASGGTTAIIETAQASGLSNMEPTPENALRAHSYGCGQLISAALDSGASEIVLGLGGSAMSDGGSGALRALGLKPLDAAGNLVPLGGGSLAEVVSVDSSALDPRLNGVKFRIAVDVLNPLYGPEGAAHVFAWQKGADSDAVELLDAGLRNWAAVLKEATGVDVNVPGAGAAGGFPASFLALTEASLEGGFALVAGLTGLDEQMAQADLVITGEGCIDSQSLVGKAPISLADSARERGIPVVVVAGRILVSPEDLASHGVVAAAQLLDVARRREGVPDQTDAMANAGRYLSMATSQLLEGS
jgi:glycerate kinase